MSKRRALWFLVLVLVGLPILAGGCQQSTVVGTERRPIQLYLAPSGRQAVSLESGEAIATFLEAQTGYAFEVRAPATQSDLVEEFGASDNHVMAFVPAKGYVLAADRHGADVALVTVRYGWGFTWAQYLVACDSEITSLQQLHGRSWAYPDAASTTGYLVPASNLVQHGIEPGERVVAGGHPQSVRAVYEGQADFATTFFSPPGEEGDWQIGDPPQPMGEIEIVEDRGAVRAYAGDLRIRDARTGILSAHRDVLERVCILAISDPIPNEAVSFSGGFPAAARESIVQALLDYAETEEGLAVLGNAEFYGISGFTRVDDSMFDPVRDMIYGLELEDDDILH